MDFRKLLTFEARQSMAAEQQVVDQMLSDPAALPAKLLDMARKVSSADIWGDSEYRSMEQLVVSRFIPEMVRRIDPSITLLPHEVPQKDEAKDSVTYVPDLSDRQLVTAFFGHLHYHGFHAALKCDDEDVRCAGRILSREQVHGNPLTETANLLVPGAYAGPRPREARPDLAIYQLTSVVKGHERVVAFADTAEELEREMNDVISKRIAFGTKLEDSEIDEITSSVRWKHLLWRESDLEALRIRDWKTGETSHELDYQAALRREAPAPGF